MGQKRKRVAKVLRVLAVLVFLFPFFVGAATTDDFIRGYGAAVLEREFQVKNYYLQVLDGTVRVTSGELKNVDTARLITGLFAVEGVKRVELLDSEGVVIASSTTPPQASTTPTTSKDKPADRRPTLAALFNRLSELPGRSRIKKCRRRQLRRIVCALPQPCTLWRSLGGRISGRCLFNF
jgi:hypothetical protein